MQIGPHLDLVAGLRLDDYAAQISNSINVSNTPGNTTLAAASQRSHYASVRTGAIFKPTQAQSYYVSYSTSFDPSLEQLTSTTGVSAPLPPETNKAYEAGAQVGPARRSVSLDAAVFQITQDNSRSQNSDNTYTADGTVRVKGARLGFTGEDHAAVAGVRRLDLPGRPHHQGDRARHARAWSRLNTPRQTATLWTTYAVTPHLEAGTGGVVSCRAASPTTPT